MMQVRLHLKNNLRFQDRLHGYNLTEYSLLDILSTLFYYEISSNWFAKRNFFCTGVALMVNQYFFDISTLAGMVPKG